MNKLVYWMAFVWLLVQNVLAQCPSITPLSISKITVSESRCKATGKAVIQVNGGVAPYAYQIVAGPFIPPVQSTNIFESLEASSYTIKVSDQCNKSVTKVFEVKGSYEIPQLTAVMSPPSCSEINGSLEVKVTNTNARPPFKFALIAPSPEIVSSQPSPLFSNLSPGTYTYRVTDSCGNYQSRTITLAKDAGTLSTINVGNLRYIDCNSYAVDYNIRNTGRDTIYTINFKGPNGSVNTKKIASVSNTIKGTYYFDHKHVTGRVETYTISFEDACGKLISRSNDLRLLDLKVVDITAQNLTNDGCNSQSTYNFDYKKENAGLRCDSTFYTLVSPSGNILAVQRNAEFSGYPAEKGYKVIREDCCSKDSIVFDWLKQPQFGISSLTTMRLSSCKEGTTNIAIKTNYPIIADLIIASGPASVKFMDGTVHQYTYPDTIKDLSLSDTQNTLINYFGEGTYKILVIDKCGRKDSANIVIKPTELRNTSFAVDYVLGCENANKIIWRLNTNFFGWVVDIKELTNYSRNVRSYTFMDSVVNLKSGSYTVNYKFMAANHISGYLNNMQSIGCDVIERKLVIPDYKQPAFKSPVVTVCGNNLNVTLLADSTKGMAPYLYQITSKPYATDLRVNNNFLNLAKGTYTFLMSDACGNSYSQNTSIDTLVFPTLSTSGKNCAGDKLTLSVALYPFYSYVWQHPNGTKTQGNVLTVGSLSSADTGIYKITVTPNIFGCTKSRTQSVKVNFCKVLPLDFLSFEGSHIGTSVLVTWQVANEIPSDRFVVERSNNGLSFETVAQLAVSQKDNYGYEDLEMSASSSYYYRIKLLHEDGSFAYSKSIFLSNNTQSTELDVYPIPTEDVLHVKWSTQEETETLLEIMNVSGHTVWADRIGHQNAIDISVRFLPSGLYLLKVYKQGETVVKKFVKQ